VKALISGAGVAGFLHALAYRVHGVTIAGVFDPDAQRARDLADLHGARAVGTLEELSRIDADLASLCSPPRHHVAQAEALAQADRSLLIEKPVAVSLEELARLTALPRCIPVVQWRSGRALRAVRAAIARGELGEAPVAGCDLAWARDDAYLRARGESWGCGAVQSIGIHAIDALEWALDRKVTNVSGVTTRRAGAWAETGAAGLITFVGGALASFRLSLDGGGDSTRLTFCGNGVTASIAGGEGDPTGTTVAWSVARGPGAHARRASLETLERETRGALGSPLLVPYVGDVIAALRDGCVPGDTQHLPSIADCSSAHETALRIAASGNRASASALRA
jgi:predicted dehydrogenase